MERTLNNKQTPSWSQRRGDLNHNRLKNQFLIGLANALNVLEDNVAATNFENRFCNGLLPQWINLRSEIRHLTRSVVEETAPSRFISQWPTNHRSVRDDTWLAELIDELWKAKHGITALCDATLAHIDQADERYEQIMALFPEGCFLPETADQIDQLKEAIINFHDSCEEITACLSRFPVQFQPS